MSFPAHNSWRNQCFYQYQTIDGNLFAAFTLSIEILEETGFHITKLANPGGWSGNLVLLQFHTPPLGLGLALTIGGGTNVQ